MTGATVVTRGRVFVAVEAPGRGYLLAMRFDVSRWWIADLEVAEAYRRHGVGSALVARLIDEEAPSSVGLFVEVSNPARRLYARHGFVVVAATHPCPPGFVEMHREAGR